MKAKVSKAAMMANQANNSSYRTGNAIVSHTREGCVVKHIEAMAALPVGATLNLAGRVDMNPAEAGVFPWLSGIARSYSLYRWKKAKVFFVSRVPTTTPGFVALGDFYEEQDMHAYVVTPTGQTLVNTNSGMVGATWCSSLQRIGKGGNFTAPIMLEFDFAKGKDRNAWYTVDHLVDHTNVARTNQQCAAFFGYYVSQGNTDTIAGELLCEYEIEFLNPKSPTLDVNPPPAALAAPKNDGEGEGTGGHRWRWLKPEVPNIPKVPTPP